MSVVAGPPAWAAPGREPGLPNTRTAAARPPTLPMPWRGGAFWIQRTRTAATAAARRERLRQLDLSPSSHPGLRASFPGEEGSGRGAGGGVGAAGKETRGCAARLAATPFLSLHPSPAFPVLSRSRPGLREAAPGAHRAGGGWRTSPSIWRPAPPPPDTRAPALSSPPPPRPRPSPAGPAGSGQRPRRAEPGPWGRGARAGGGRGATAARQPEGARVGRIGRRGCRCRSVECRDTGGLREAAAVGGGPVWGGRTRARAGNCATASPLCSRSSRLLVRIAERVFLPGPRRHHLTGTFAKEARSERL